MCLSKLYMRGGQGGGVWDNWMNLYIYIHIYMLENWKKGE